VLYHRVPRLLAALDLAHDDGRYSRLLRPLGVSDVAAPLGANAQTGR
jgi:hypothetical protein